MLVAIVQTLEMKCFPTSHYIAPFCDVSYLIFASTTSNDNQSQSNEGFNDPVVMLLNDYSLPVAQYKRGKVVYDYEVVEHFSYEAFLDDRRWSRK